MHHHSLGTVFSAVLLALCFVSPKLVAQNPWQSFPDAKLVEQEFFDGDSFLVEVPNNGNPQKHVVRLYFVDAPETSADTDSDKKRVLEQSRYFGIQPPPLVLEHGAAAREFVREALREPFTLHTAFASAPGRSKLPRIYSLITTSRGTDLSADLVSAGLARTHGLGRALPDGTSAQEYSTRLADLEASAMLARRGIWADADAETLANARATERAEAGRLRELFDSSPSSPVNLNEASPAQLQTLPGVGAVLAQRLVEARPFSSLDDVTRVRGISPSLLERWENLVTISASESSQPR